MTTSASVPRLDSKILGAIPLIKHFTDRIRLVKIIDGIIPKKKAPGDVTHGECVLIMLICLLDGDHRLVHIEKKLLDMDLTALLGRPGVSASAFNDTRLGTALDALYPNTAQIYGNILAAAIKEFGIQAKRLHVDTTTIILHGLYETLGFLTSVEEPPPIPARGFSKDHRPDLLQLVCGMVMTEEGIPVLGKFEDGNSSDVKLFRDYLADIPAVSELFKTSRPILIGDSKLCTTDTIYDAMQLGVDLLSLLPESFALRRELVDKVSNMPDLPLLYSSKDGGEYYGQSIYIPMAFERPGGKPIHAMIRFLVTYSTQLVERKQETRRCVIARERKALDAMIKKLEQTDFACEADAQKITKYELKAAKAKFHKMSFAVQTTEVAIKSRGRPSKNALPQAIKIVWRVTIDVQETPGIARPYDLDGFFVLITSITDKRRKSDAELLRALQRAAYRGNWVQMVERSTGSQSGLSGITRQNSITGLYFASGRSVRGTAATTGETDAQEKRGHCGQLSLQKVGQPDMARHHVVV